MNDCLSEMKELIAGELQGLNNPQETAERILIRIRERFAKECVYVSFDYEKRNSDIYARYNGKNSRQLAREFGLSTRQIERIIKERWLERQIDWTV